MEVELESHSLGPFRIVTAHFEAGDTMALHRHMSRGHLSMVIDGELIAHVTGSGDLRLVEGDVAYWPIGTEHSWEAMSDATLINVFLL